MPSDLLPYVSQLQILLSVVVAMALGGVVGYERESTDRPAGLRTHMLVAGAAALLVGLSRALVTSFGIDVGTGLVQTDPIRTVEAVITGISFIAAGSIIRAEGGRVEGLTTAAAFLFVSGVGICCALDQWVLAVGSTLLVLFTLRGVRLLERWTGTKGS